MAGISIQIDAKESAGAHAPLPFAHVFVSDSKGKPTGARPNAAATDLDGNTELHNITKGNYVTVSNMGFVPRTFQVTDLSKKDYHIWLDVKSNRLKEFEVIADKPKPKPKPKPRAKPKMPAKPKLATGIGIAAFIAAVALIGLIFKARS